MKRKQEVNIQIYQKINGQKRH